MNEQQSDEDIEHPGTTAWVNPLDHDREIRVMVAPGQYQIYRFPKGKVVRVPRDYDGAIHQLSGKEGDRQRSVIGGLDPFLKRVSGENYPVHSSYFPKQTAAEEIAEMKAKLADAERRLAEAELERKTAPAPAVSKATARA